MFRISVSMSALARRVVAILVSVCSLLSAVLIAQSGLAIRAASNTPVAGWQQMKSPDGDHVWVAPTTALTSRDIVRAERSTRADGRAAVAVVFTKEGAAKIAALSTAQHDKPIAVLLDGVLIWAPIVRSVIGEKSELSGGAEGLRAEDIERLLVSLNRR